jgi:hypothetical protein
MVCAIQECVDDQEGRKAIARKMVVAWALFLAW